MKRDINCLIIEKEFIKMEKDKDKDKDKKNWSKAMRWISGTTMDMWKEYENDEEEWEDNRDYNEYWNSDYYTK